MKREAAVATFWALSDPVRVEILDRIAAGTEVTVTQLADVLPMTRQAVTRHMKTLEATDLVAGRKSGRELRYHVQTEAMRDAGHWLDRRAASWQRALGRLSAYLEED